MILDAIYILTFIYSAYLDFKRREIFMPIVWVLLPLTIIWAVLRTTQATLGLIISVLTILALNLYLRAGKGDIALFVIYSWYIATITSNTYQIYFITPPLIGLLIALLYKVYPITSNRMIKKKSDLIVGDIILEKYTSDLNRVLVYHGKPFVMLLFLACGCVYLGLWIFFL